MNSEEFIPVSPDKRLDEMKLTREEKTFLRTFAEKDYKFIDHDRFETETDFPNPHPDVMPVVDWVDRITESKTRRKPTFVLTKKDEQSLFIRYNFFRKQIRQTQLIWEEQDKLYMTTKEIHKLLSLYREVLFLEKQIISFNAGLAFKLLGIKKNKDSIFDDSDLRRESYFALLKAIRNFDIRLDYKFSTYSFRVMSMNVSKEEKNELEKIKRHRPISHFQGENEKYGDPFARIAQDNGVSSLSGTNTQDLIASEQDRHFLKLIETYLDPESDWGENTLKPKEIQAVKTRYDPEGGEGFGGLTSYNIVAARMGLSKQMAQKHVTSGIEKLRSLLEEDHWDLEIPRLPATGRKSRKKKTPMVERLP